MLNLRAALVSSCALLALSGCGGGNDTRAPECAVGAAFDITGTYTERYNCSEDGTCVEEDLTAVIVISPVNILTGEYEFTSPGSDWTGEGALCGTSFEWSASTATYTETGVWTFSDNSNFVKSSSYQYTGMEGGGTCSGTAAQVGEPPLPAPVGGCPQQ